MSGPLAHACPACLAPAGARCTEHATTRHYKTVHLTRGQLVGMTPQEILRFRYEGDDETVLDSDMRRHLAVIDQLCTDGDEVRLLRTALKLALDLAAEHGASQREVALLRRVGGVA